MSLAIRFDAVSKSFGEVEVLHEVSFALAPNKIYGLLGENGAGKSTLVKILSGYEQKTSGRVFIDEAVLAFGNSKEAEHAGVVLIHQEFNLAEPLTITQNMFLGQEILLKNKLLDEESMHSAAEKALLSVGLSVSPKRQVRSLIVAEKQMVEIAKALSRRARLLIMDEPTATLTPTETARLFDLMRRLKEEGVTIIYISHKLDEVKTITDEVIFMRDGSFVGREMTVDVSRQDMANLMVGRDVSDLYPPKERSQATHPYFEVTKFSVPNFARDVSFRVSQGEIFGFAGLVGAGRTELFEGILGLRPKTSGQVRIGDQNHVFKTPEEAVRAGLSYLSEDRKGKGLHVHMGLKENLSLLALECYAAPFLDHGKEAVALKDKVSEFGIRTGRLQNAAKALSGGNQQKLALAKFLHPDPNIIVLDEPTRGVDVGAKRDIYFFIQKLAKEGRTVIVISSELLELIGICHRVAVMRQGKIEAILEGEHLNEQEIILYATGSHA